MLAKARTTVSGETIAVMEGHLRRITPSSPLTQGEAWNDHAALMPGQVIFPHLFKKLPDAPGRIKLPDFGATPRRRGYMGYERGPALV